MKISKYLNIVLGVLLSISLIYIINLKNTETETKTNNDNQETLSNLNSNETETEKEYNCSFTKTYNIVNKLDGYIAEVLELSYIVVDQFQSHGAMTHIIPTELKNSLEVNKSYEFTYTLKGKGTINDMFDVYSHLSGTTVNKSQNNEDLTNLSVTLTIKETDKTGLSQIQENICQN